MTTERNSRALYEKMEQELEDFYAGLKTMSPEDIISHSYEKVMKDDFLMLFGEYDELTEEMVKKLLEKEKPLDFVYQEWLGADYGYMDTLQEFLRCDVSRELEKVQK